MADTSTYPATLDGDLRALVPAGTTPTGFEDFLQLVADAVTKIQTELGTNPSGSAATVAAALDAKVSKALSVNAQTGTTYTVALSDEQKLVTLSDAAAITVTLPQDSDVAIPVGGQIHFTQLGAGQVTFTAGTGATVNSTPTASTRAQYSTVTAIKRAANTWLLVGDLAAAP